MSIKIKSQTVFATYIALPGINAGELEEKTFMESRIFYISVLSSYKIQYHLILDMTYNIN